MKRLPAQSINTKSFECVTDLREGVISYKRLDVGFSQSREVVNAR